MCPRLFDIQPITTSNLFTVVQILVVAVGFLFSWRSLKATRDSVALATDNAMAQLVNQMIVQGRDLKYKVMELDKSSLSQTEISSKREQFNGMIIAYYSSCFELRRILTLPANISLLLDNELKYLMTEAAMQKRWEAVKSFYSQEFQLHVESLKEK